jgi:HlyD family secretion protein
VTGVSKFPASPDMIGQAIPNKAIAEALLAEGAPIEIHADLIPDPHTFSGFKWTSSDGPRTEIQVGTMVVGSVRVRERRPITLVLPFLKKLFGVQ